MTRCSRQESRCTAQPPCCLALLVKLYIGSSIRLPVALSHASVPKPGSCPPASIPSSLLATTAATCLAMVINPTDGRPVPSEIGRLVVLHTRPSKSGCISSAELPSLSRGVSKGGQNSGARHPLHCGRTASSSIPGCRCCSSLLMRWFKPPVHLFPPSPCPPPCDSSFCRRLFHAPRFDNPSLLSTNGSYSFNLPLA